MLDSAVNQHYLDKVMDLAEEMPVVATEDIFDARGNKLLAKGAKVSRSLQEKLILHKLTRPIEMSLSVSGGVDAKLIVGTAERLIATCPPVAAFVEATRNCGGASPLAILSPLQFGNAMTMMLTIVERGGANALDHSVMVAVVAICLAKHAKLSAEDQACCGLAGLLHDVGELYVDPAFLTPGRALAPHEWSHLIVHPKTAQMLVDELESCPKNVGRAIAEHHERLDGTGYPRRLQGKAISMCGQVLAVAEAICGLLRADHPLDRAELALKLMTREHDRVFLGAISAAKRQLPREAHEPFPSGTEFHASDIYHRLGRCTGVCSHLINAPGLSAATREKLGTVLERLQFIQRAAVSSGLDLELSAEEVDGLLVFEHTVAARELTWRLKDIARDLAMNELTNAERLMLAPLFSELEPPSTEDTRQAA